MSDKRSVEIEQIIKDVQELKLRVQTLEDEFKKLKDGEVGTGIYLQGCDEATIEYISGKTEKKAGE
jgi:cell division protein FtsB